MPRSHPLPVRAGVVVGAVVLALLPVPSTADARPPSLETRWERAGFGEVRALATGDLTGDGQDEVVLAGRRVGLVSAHGDSDPLWANDWPFDPANVLDGGDNMWATGAQLVPGADGAPDVLVATTRHELVRIDGATGATTWRSERFGNGGSHGFAVFPTPDGGLGAFPTGGRVALSVETGEQLWEAPLPKGVRYAAAGRIGAGGQPGVVVAITPPGLGTNPSSIAPAMTAETVFGFLADGTPTFAFRGTSVSALAAVDLGGGADSTVVGLASGQVVALDAAGAVRWAAAPGLGPVAAVATGPPAPGGGRQVLVALDGGPVSGLQEVVALSPQGAVLWRHRIGQPVRALLLDGSTLLVGAGTDAASSTRVGVAVALDANVVSVQRERWRRPALQQVGSLAVVDHGGRRLALLGSHDATLSAVDLATGAPAWRFLSGGFLYSAAAGDLDGDGSGSVVTGDDRGNLAVTDADGGLRFAAQVDVGTGGAIHGVAIGQADGAGRPEVVGVASRLGQSPGGSVSLFDANGALRWTASTPGYAERVALADLDGDGVGEVVVAEWTAPDLHECTVAAHDGRTGVRRWTAVMPGACIAVNLAVGDATGDGRLEVAVGSLALFSSPFVGLVAADGRVLWSHPVPEGTAWLQVVPGGVVHGGFASSSRGHVTRRSAPSGAVQWQQLLDAYPGPETTGAASRFGVVLPGGPVEAPWIGLTTDAGDVRAVSAADGSTVWSARIADYGVTPAQRHQSGPLAAVASADGEGLVAPQYAIGRKRASVLGLSSDGLLGPSRLPLRGEAHAATALPVGPGEDVAAVAAGLTLYAVGVASER